MIIHKPTLTRHATLEAARRHYAKYTASLSPIGAGISLDPSDPALAIDLAVAGYYDEVPPVYDPATQKLGALVWDDDLRTATPAVIDYTVEELAANRTVVVSQMWQQIQEERERRRIGGVLVAGKWFHSDDPSRIQHVGLTIIGANLPTGIMWKTMDGSFIEMTPALVGAIFQGLVAADQANFATAETHRAAMTASDDPASYDFSAGWVETYGG